jgi:hypothetical protein
MPKKSKTTSHRKGAATLHLQENQIRDMLSAFASHDIRALMILEKDGTVMVNTNGFNSRALLPFLVDLFLSHPELYRACTKITQEKLSGSGEEALDHETVH